MKPRTGVYALHVHAYDADLAVVTSRVYGYRAKHADGWQGAVRRSYAAARTDLGDHRRELRGVAAE